MALSLSVTDIRCQTSKPRTDKESSDGFPSERPGITSVKMPEILNVTENSLKKKKNVLPLRDVTVETDTCRQTPKCKNLVR